MVLLLRTWVCDTCDAELKRTQTLPTGPFEDPDYQPVKVDKGPIGDGEWANKMLHAGKTLEVATCSCGSNLHVGRQYRIRSHHLESTDKSGAWVTGYRVQPSQTLLGKDHGWRVVP